MTITSVSGISGQTVAINAQTASYTLTSTDAAKVITDRKSTRLNSSHITRSRMPSSA